MPEDAGAQLLRINPDGPIVEMTLFGRPLPALTAVMAALGARLVRRQVAALLVLHFEWPSRPWTD